MSDTLRAALTAATHALASSASARLDAELLLAKCLQRTRAYLFGHADEPLPDAAADCYARLIERRAGGEPLAYIIGEQEFWSLSLAVTPAVLIPRADTETLVEHALSYPFPARCLDLGTGSGAIAIALASDRPDFSVVATDRSAAALEIARGNAQRHAVRIDFRQGDWFEPVAGERFDLIVSNPPYIAEHDPHLDALVFEPRAALVAADDGLADLHHLVRGALDHLNPGGWLVLEHGFEQAPAVAAAMRKAGWRDVRTLEDLAGQPRVTTGVRP